MASAAILNAFCTICSENYLTGETILSTSCGHVFHGRCFENWRARIPDYLTCPECRKRNPNTSRIFLNLTNPQLDEGPESSTTQDSNLIKRISLLERKLEENEKNFFEAQLALTKAEARIEDLTGELDVKRARIESYDQKIQDLQLTYEDSETNLLNSLGELAKTESALQINKQKLESINEQSTSVVAAAAAAVKNETSEIGS